MLEDIQQRRFKASLILGPASALGVWREEIKQFFPYLKLHYYYGSKGGRGDKQIKQSTIGSSVVDLVKFLHSLPDDPSTLGYIILSSYSTWQNRTLYQDSDVESGDNDEELAEEVIRTIKSYIPLVFYRGILDESQHLKLFRTKAHISVKLLCLRFINVATAMAMVNRTTDLTGHLNLFWKDSMQKRSDSPPPSPSNPDPNDDDESLSPQLAEYSGVTR